MPITSALENVNKVGDPYLQKLQEFLANTGLTIGPAAPGHQKELNTLASATVGQIRPTPEMAIPQPAMTAEEYYKPLSTTVSSRLRPYVEAMEKRGWLTPFSPLQVVDRETLKKVAESGTAAGATLTNPAEMLVKGTAPSWEERALKGLISEDYQARTLLHENMHASLQASGIEEGYGPKILQRIDELGIPLYDDTRKFIEKNLNPKKYSKVKEARWAEEALARVSEKLSPKEFEYIMQDVPNYKSPLSKGEFISGMQQPEAKLKEAEAPQPITPQKINESIQSEPGYLYHATNEERLHEIANSGKLKTHRPSEFTDQAAWPDGSTERRNYFSQKAETVWQFAPEEGTPVAIRTKLRAGFQRESTGDMYSKAPVKAKDLEFLGSDNKWHPVTGLTEKKAETLKPREESHLNVALSEASKVVGYGRLKAKLTEMLGDVEKVNKAFERAGIKE